MARDELIHDDVFAWDGWGGVMKLASGRCRLRIFDLGRGAAGDGPTLLKPTLVVVNDLPKEKLNDMSVRSCCGNVATSVVAQFGIDPQRMIWVEYSRGSFYGERRQHAIAERLERVEFTWRDDKALKPQWHPLQGPLYDRVLQLINDR
jgi:hypothetical protein